MNRRILLRPVYLPPPCCISIWVLRQPGGAGKVHRPQVAEDNSFVRCHSPNRLDGLNSLNRLDGLNRLHRLNPEWRIQPSECGVRSTSKPFWICWGTGAHVFLPLDGLSARIDLCDLVASCDQFVPWYYKPPGNCVYISEVHGFALQVGGPTTTRHRHGWWQLAN
jgi:hypothetical protein